MNVGYQDASLQMDMQRIKDGIMELAKRNGVGDTKKGANNHQIGTRRKSSLYTRKYEN
jgi:hypothetical protein